MSATATRHAGIVLGDAVPANGDALGRVLFLDRDGVINVNFGYVHTPDRIEWVPGIFDLCQQAHAKGYSIIVVTNQAGIARGFYGIEVFEDFTRWIHRQLLERGIPVVATIYCPHHPSAGDGPFTGPCDCRKPGIGMFELARARFGPDMAGSALVGDKVSDMQAGFAAGVGHLFLLGNAAGGEAPPPGVVSCGSLAELAPRL